jgi:hypothetical protein
MIQMEEKDCEDGNCSQSVDRRTVFDRSRGSGSDDFPRDCNLHLELKFTIPLQWIPAKCW